MAACLGERARRLVPHVRQSLTWDCGMACTEMVLRAVGVPAAECSLQSLRKHVPASSVWTIDLAYAMRAYGVRFRYCTMTMGVDPTYKNQPFYQETLDEDAIRVEGLFDKASDEGVVIEHRSIGRDELRALLRPPQENLVMTLVDRRYLYTPGWIDKFLSSARGYVGHYVLLVGYDAMRDGYYLYDPARTAEPEFARSSDLHRARLAHGTDEDVIIVPWADNHGLARMLRAQMPSVADALFSSSSGSPRDLPTGGSDDEVPPTSG